MDYDGQKCLRVFFNYTPTASEGDEATSAYTHTQYYFFQDGIRLGEIRGDNEPWMMPAADGVQSSLEDTAIGDTCFYTVSWPLRTDSEVMVMAVPSFYEPHNGDDFIGDVFAAE